MKKNTLTISLLAAAILMPILIYATLQTRSLAEDEQMANEVYSKQMETILFSLNQYADDRMNQWVRQLERNDWPTDSAAKHLVRQNEAIQLLTIRDIKNGDTKLYASDYVNPEESTLSTIDQWYRQQPNLVDQLCQYLQAGFQKIQPAEGLPKIPGLKAAQSSLTIMFYGQDSSFYSAFFVLEPYYWSEQLLGINMQEVADNNDLRLAVLYQGDTTDWPVRIFETETFDLSQDYVNNGLWLLPQTYLAIQPKGTSYAQLIRERSRNNLYILLTSIFMMLLGTGVLLRNIRKNMRIAQLKSDFVSNVSHEIRTPLSLIRMYAETLMLGRLPSEDKKQQYYEVIHHESGRLTYLVNNILDFSKIEANKKQYHLEWFPLNELAEQIHRNFAFSLNEKNMSCELYLEAKNDSIQIDKQAVEEAVSNLIDNAIKYSDGSKKIIIRTYEEGKSICCSVQDFGMGISKTAQKHIFEKFYRAEDALTQKTKGTGLGLSLVQHIMLAHGGQVTVKSKLDEGSTFTLCFPKKERND